MEFIRYLRLQHQTELPYVTHFPAGGNRSAVTGRLLRDMGTATGWPDYQYMRPMHQYHGLFIEAKTPCGQSPTAVQQAKISLLRRQGYAVAVCFGLDEMIEAFNAYRDGLTPANRKVFDTTTKMERKKWSKGG